MFCRKFDSCRILKILSNSQNPIEFSKSYRILKILSNILYPIEYSYGSSEDSMIYLTFSIAYSIYSTSHWSSARPGPRDCQNIFAVASCCVPSSSRFRGSNVLVSPGPASSLGSRSLSTIGIRSSLPCPCTGLWISLVRRGLRSALT